jgi:hypothetical protein
MSLRKAIGAAPLAVSVAVLAHVIVLGFSHEPGGGRSAELFSSLCLALAFGVAGSFGSGFFAVDAPRAKNARPSIAATFLLAAAGTAIFGGIECTEGNSIFGSMLAVAIVSIPIAFVVLAIATAVRRVATAAGFHYGAFVRRVCRRRAADVTQIVFVTRTRVVVFAVARRAMRGRAPPLQA